MSPIVFKEKRKIKVTNLAIPWIWKPFRSSARKDGSVFHHWVKASDKSDDHSFARFNKKITMLDYTNEQYHTHFNGDPLWTREETDQLWDLCKRYDVRFVVIADRFEGNKSMEDLKNRYYTISRKLLELNASADEDVSKHPLKKFVYKYEHEVERKKQYEKLYSRSKEEVEEERRLVQEYKRIESNIKKHQKEKKRVLKLTQSSLSTFGQPDKKKKLIKKKDAQMDTANAEDGFAFDQPATPTSNPIGIKGIRKEKASGAFLRGTTFLLPLGTGIKTAKRVDEIMDIEIGRQPMATVSVCKVYNEIRKDLATLLDLQKHVAQKDYQLQMLKEQKTGFTKPVKMVAPKFSLPKSGELDLLSTDLMDFTPEKTQKKRLLSSSDKLEKKLKKKKKEKE